MLRKDVEYFNEMPLKLLKNNEKYLFWPFLGRSWPLLGCSWPLLGRSWLLLGRSWPLLGRSWPLLVVLGRS